jgi:hypothetical protein
MRICLDSCPLAHIIWRVFSLNLLPFQGPVRDFVLASIRSVQLK